MRNQALNAADESDSKVAFDVKDSLQLLADIRDCFAYHGYPRRLATSALFGWLHSRSNRSWNIDGLATANRIARLLAPFEIYPRLQRIGSASPSRGYQLEAFLPQWQARLGFDLAAVTHVGQSEIANKDADCYSVTHSDVDFPKPSENQTENPPRRVAQSAQ